MRKTRRIYLVERYIDFGDDLGTSTKRVYFGDLKSAANFMAKHCTKEVKGYDIAEDGSYTVVSGSRMKDKIEEHYTMTPWVLIENYDEEDKDEKFWETALER